MFNQNDIETEQGMRDRFKEYIEFLNNDFFNREYNCLKTKKLGNRLVAKDAGSFSFLVFNDEMIPLAFVDLLGKSITIVKANNYVKGKCLEASKEFFNNIESNYYKKINSVFSSNKKRKNLREGLDYITKLKDKTDENILSIDNISDGVADLITYSFQEKFDTDVIHDIKLQTLHIREDDFVLADIFFEEGSVASTIYNIMADLLMFKFSILLEEEHND